MEIKLDKDYIRASKVKELKEMAKQFKATYTDGDLLRAFTDATEAYINGDVIAAKVECFEANSYSYGPELSVRVELIVCNWSEFYRITYYADDALNVDTEQRSGNGIREPFYLYEVETFRKVKE